MHPSFLVTRQNYGHCWLSSFYVFFTCPACIVLDLGLFDLHDLRERSPRSLVVPLLRLWLNEASNTGNAEIPSAPFHVSSSSRTVHEYLTTIDKTRTIFHSRTHGPTLLP